MSLSSCREAGKAGTVDSEFPSRFNRFSHVQFWGWRGGGGGWKGGLGTGVPPARLGSLGMALGWSCPGDTYLVALWLPSSRLDEVGEGFENPYSVSPRSDAPLRGLRICGLCHLKPLRPTGLGTPRSSPSRPYPPGEKQQMPGAISHLPA